MSSEDKTGEQPTKAPQKSDFILPEQGDWFLQLLLRLANEASMGIGLTLHVGGTIIAGNLASAKQYYEAFSSEFADGMAAMFKRAGSTDYADIIETTKQAMLLGAKGYEPPADGRKVANPYFLHLEDARVFQPGAAPMPTNRGVWYRVRIDRIDAFCLGRLDPN